MLPKKELHSSVQATWSASSLGSCRLLLRAESGMTSMASLRLFWLSSMNG